MESQALALEQYDENRTEDDTIRKLIEQTETFSPDRICADVHRFFEDHPTSEGVVVLDEGKPVGLIMRNELYQKFGSLYGRDIFMRRPIQLLINSVPLIVDVALDIASISLIAMNREQQKLYDIVIVTEDDNYIGVVSIKRFMVELSRQREKEIELLKKQKEILHMANEAEILHRKQIETINNALWEKNDSIKNLLDNAGQGFLSFGSDMIISEEHSLECVEMFRGSIGGEDFMELIGRHLPRETADTVSSVMKSVFSAADALQQKVYLSLLPDEATIYDRIVRIEYKIIKHLGRKKMMLVLTDITEKKSLEMKMAEEKKNLELVVKALSRQPDVNAGIDEFRSFVTVETQAILANTGSPSAALAEIFRLVHTFKGDFAQLGLHNTAAELHEIEDSLAALGAQKGEHTLANLAEVVNQWDPEAILRDDFSVLSNILGESFFVSDERFSIARDRLIEIERRVELVPAGDERSELVSLIRSLRHHNLKDLLMPYNDYLLALAGRLDKSIEPIQITGDDIFIAKEAYIKFVKCLTHVFRNMIDHGIETVEERVEANKRESGKISCHINRQGAHELCLAISDDGRGIDAEKIRTLAVQKGMLTAERASAICPEEMYELLFLDSFSTKDCVTALSGRGVGLSAVKAETEELGGHILVESEPGRGSRFSFILPILAD